MSGNVFKKLSLDSIENITLSLAMRYIMNFSSTKHYQLPQINALKGNDSF